MLLYLPDSFDQFTHQHEEPHWEKLERLDYCDRTEPKHDSLSQILGLFRQFFEKAA